MSRAATAGRARMEGSFSASFKNSDQETSSPARAALMAGSSTRFQARRPEIRIAVIGDVVDEGGSHGLGHQMAKGDRVGTQRLEVELVQDVEGFQAHGIEASYIGEIAVSRRRLLENARPVAREIGFAQDAPAGPASLGQGASKLALI